MLFHENCLPADNSHEIACLFVIFEKAAKFENCRLLQIIGGALWVKEEMEVHTLCESSHVTNGIQMLIMVVHMSSAAL